MYSANAKVHITNTKRTNKTVRFGNLNLEPCKSFSLEKAQTPIVRENALKNKSIHHPQLFTFLAGHCSKNTIMIKKQLSKTEKDFGVTDFFRCGSAGLLRELEKSSEKVLSGRKTVREHLLSLSLALKPNE